MNDKDAGDDAFARELHRRIKAMPDDPNRGISHGEFMNVAAKTAVRHPLDFLGFVSWLRRTTTPKLVAAIERLHRSVKCSWHGHDIEASAIFDGKHSRFVYRCKRCECPLPGPEKG